MRNWDVLLYYDSSSGQSSGTLLNKHRPSSLSCTKVSQLINLLSRNYKLDSLIRHEAIHVYSLGPKDIIHMLEQTVMYM